MKKARNTLQEWLFFFYSVPSKPVNNRMKVWRTLAKAGAVQFKGSVYILPFSDDHFEFFQWLVSSVKAMKGDAAFVRVSNAETINSSEIIEQFDEQRAKDYLQISDLLDGLETRLRTMEPGSLESNGRKIAEQLHKWQKEFEEVGKIDFFSSSARKLLDKRLKAIASEIAGRSGAKASTYTTEIMPRRVIDYQGKTWVTRKKPFIDRIASAWLIQRFIDKNPAFGFIDENEIEHLGKDTIAYDMVGAEFTHVGDLCTFEVLMKTFGLNDQAVGILAEIVHQLDLKDEKYKHPAAEGLREIFDGIRKTTANDHEALEKGMGVFEMLYASKK